MTYYLKYVFLALFAFFAVIHLIDCWNFNEKRRVKTKPFLVPLILCYYLFSVGAPFWMLVVALITSWLGDVLLIPTGKTFFLAGGVSFTVAHVLFILIYKGNVDFAAVNWLIVVPVALIYIAATVWSFIMLRKYLDPFMKFGLTLYLLINAAMNLFALMQLMTHPGLGAALVYVGAILFFTSDVVLFLARFHENKELVPKRNFVIMFTYIAAEFLITQGLMLLGE